jgi:hypothetical protein
MGDIKAVAVHRRQPMLDRQPNDEIAVKRHRRRRPGHDQAAVRGAREDRDAALDLVCVAYADRCQLDPKRRRHTVCNAANPPEPAGREGFRMTATQVTRGAISLSSSSHLPLRLKSCEAKPVALAPGRARLATQAPPTGSMTVTNTIGTVRVVCCKAPTIAPDEAKRISGLSATNSAAYRERSTSLVAQR